MPVVHIGNIEYVATATQRTAPSLHIMNANGDVYHVAVLPADGDVEMSHAREELVYQANAVNTCESVTLPAGFYRAELRGGAGGLPGGGLVRCRTGVGRINFNGETVSATFKLDKSGTVYVFRGGDGNDAPGEEFNGRYSSVGGAASGVDSMVVVGGRVIMAHGGNGSFCGASIVYSSPGGGAAALAKHACSGGGGGYAVSYGATVLDGKETFSDERFSCGAGGGGAPFGRGAAAHDTYDLAAGNAGNANSGGDGGDAVCFQDTSLVGRGGRGGENVAWQCGGATAYSYGGGGFCHHYAPTECAQYGRRCGVFSFDGGPGGSGSTGGSDVSFVKIYKIG